MLRKIVHLLLVAAALASTLTLQGCFGSEQEKTKQAEQAEQEKASKTTADQKALRQRQCEFIGKTATDKGQCVAKN